MNLFSDLTTMSVIFLLLGLFFTLVAVLNAWRRKRLSTAQTPREGPILMSDPHSGAPVSLRPPPVESASMQPVPYPPINPVKPPTGKDDKALAEPKAAHVKGSQFFRQLDARGVDVDATRGGKHDDYQWE
ncbi:MAG: hypothetical protein R6X19_03950 [Kiritimatiellia bacterium]